MKLSSMAQVYEPVYGGNRGLPEGERCRVHCLYLRHGDVMELARAQDGEADRRLIARYVTAVENLELDGKPVRDGGELARAEVPGGLIAEIVRHLLRISGLGAETEKN